MAYGLCSMYLLWFLVLSEILYMILLQNTDIDGSELSKVIRTTDRVSLSDLFYRISRTALST